MIRLECGLKNDLYRSETRMGLNCRNLNGLFELLRSVVQTILDIPDHSISLRAISNRVIAQINPSHERTCKLRFKPSKPQYTCGSVGQRRLAYLQTGHAHHTSIHNCNSACLAALTQIKAPKAKQQRPHTHTHTLSSPQHLAESWKKGLTN